MASTRFLSTCVTSDNFTMNDQCIAMELSSLEEKKNFGRCLKIGQATYTVPFSNSNGVVQFFTSSTRLPLIVIDTINMRQKPSRCIGCALLSIVDVPRCICTETLPAKLSGSNGVAPSRYAFRHSAFVFRNAAAIAHNTSGALDRIFVELPPRALLQGTGFICRPSKHSTSSAPLMVCRRHSVYTCPGVGA
jgi:hypothetical protein